MGSPGLNIDGGASCSFLQLPGLDDLPELTDEHWQELTASLAAVVGASNPQALCRASSCSPHACDEQLRAPLQLRQQQQQQKYAQPQQQEQQAARLAAKALGYSAGLPAQAADAQPLARQTTDPLPATSSPSTPASLLLAGSTALQPALPCPLAGLPVAASMAARQATGRAAAPHSIISSSPEGLGTQAPLQPGYVGPAVCFRGVYALAGPWGADTLT